MVMRFFGNVIEFNCNTVIVTFKHMQCGANTQQSTVQLYSNAISTISKSDNFHRVRNKQEFRESIHNTPE